MFTGVPKVFNLFWNASLDDEGVDSQSDAYEDDYDSCSDLAGYTCTPLVRAYDLFAILLEASSFHHPQFDSFDIDKASSHFDQRKRISCRPKPKKV